MKKQIAVAFALHTGSKVKSEHIGSMFELVHMNNQLTNLLLKSDVSLVKTNISDE